MSRINRPEDHEVLKNAIDSDRYDTVEKIFRNNTNRIDQVEHVAGSNFHYACSSGLINSVSAMVDLGADIESTNGFLGDTPLLSACVHARTPVVDFLISKGCRLDVSSSSSNPLFVCLRSLLHWNRHHAKSAGYEGRTDARTHMAKTAILLIRRGLDLTACYTQKSMVDMDASAFSYYLGFPEIAALVIEILYAHDERLKASAHAEALEVAIGNGYSCEKFRRRRYPPKRGKNASWRPDPGEYWV